MAVVIRQARHGRKKIPIYRIVAADKEMPRDGRYLELLGTVNPLTDPITLTLKEDRVKYWIGVGAAPSATVSAMINKKIPGLLEDLEKKRLAKVRAARSKRKARAKSSGKSAAPKKEAKAKKAKPAKVKAAKAAKK